MSTTKKLSMEMMTSGTSVVPATILHWAAEARTLEERVERAEAYVKEQQGNIGSAFQAGLAPLTARAEAAESDLAATERENERLGAALEAAEAERDALREDLNDARNGWESAAAETRRLDAKLEKLENHIKSSRQMLVDAEMLSNHLVCEAIRKACAEHGGDGFALAGRILCIIDGEGDGE